VSGFESDSQSRKAKPGSIEYSIRLIICPWLTAQERAGDDHIDRVLGEKS
jgi:hypothetical protein